MAWLRKETLAMSHNGLLSGMSLGIFVSVSSGPICYESATAAVSFYMEYPAAALPLDLGAQMTTLIPPVHGILVGNIIGCITQPHGTQGVGGDFVMAGTQMAMSHNAPQCGLVKCVHAPKCIIITTLADICISVHICA